MREARRTRSQALPPRGGHLLASRASSLRPSTRSSHAVGSDVHASTPTTHPSPPPTHASTPCQTHQGTHCTHWDDSPGNLLQLGHPCKHGPFARRPTAGPPPRRKARGAAHLLSHHILSHHCSHHQCQPAGCMAIASSDKCTAPAAPTQRHGGGGGGSGTCTEQAALSALVSLKLRATHHARCPAQQRSLAQKGKLERLVERLLTAAGPFLCAQNAVP